MERGWSVLIKIDGLEILIPIVLSSSWLGWIKAKNRKFEILSIHKVLPTILILKKMIKYIDYEI